MPNTPSDIARRWFEEVWIGRRSETIDELLTEGSVGHLATGDVLGPEGFHPFHQAFFGAFPDAELQIERIVGDNEEAIVHWRMAATHTGALGEIPASGRQVAFPGMTRFIVRDGKIMEGWDCWDSGGLIQAISAEQE